jgi:predicted nucleic acid-binding protein
VITLDTSGLIALIDPDDRHHSEAVAVFNVDPGPFFIPAAILAEIAYMLESRAGTQALLDFLADIEAEAYSRDFGEPDIPRIRQLVERYTDLPLGFADASVITCAERHGGKILTTDQRHFPVVARGEKGLRDRCR